ncbi:N-acetylmuramic acid 6-phosphate etherase [Peribacillus frigoritolerans]|jgi:N-acetylmuramic acid 6-phosphate etherase|uniref:N-acetylmuramic acid 6-phosphate etherase n=1 Tax=Peribacillus TaxID=2675229 RepID=UPI0006ACA400|nr:N-acetylmuramic acid 6-phosphate etherase [Peribacillus frigoritolerans]KOR78693.1 N-acetylmuramic acid-6-phosphate etherase [Bacillus sp. FJAT-21352]KOR83170.1 N-acetylmuramic acid-6-phosphate etherase [Bacillus sp. FJAT-22058]AZV59983.1 N-acetylmuramic acid 6-phosphate etherase [Peribacillus frigoritolerans]MDM5306175.1 N-acetylmuramic acid 6-phosphate etherase [Peribacillus frigoritolerans]USK82933.1 N-acetylmuramic acid 6-phosphate etherase [Peribacillus frigoritolerans]
MEEHLRSLTTELRNEKTMNIDSVNTMDIISAINKEDFKVAAAVQEVLPEIETAVEWACESLKKGGRLIYIGAGTSGRLGVLDAVECPPTFSTPPDRVLGIIAGGENAFVRAVEGAEDKEEFGENDLIDVALTANDTVIGIAASGRTPYVKGALRYARKVGAKAVALSCNNNASITKEADIGIEVVVGPEVLTGSTRMKAATAHKMVLNMISTATMIRLGKVYENLMVDVNVSNQKLKDRAVNIIETVTNADYDQALKTLEKANNQVKPAIVMIKTATDYEKAMELLEKADGDVRKAISIYED